MPKKRNVSFMDVDKDSIDQQLRKYHLRMYHLRLLRM